MVPTEPSRAPSLEYYFPWLEFCSKELKLCIQSVPGLNTHSALISSMAKGKLLNLSELYFPCCQMGIRSRIPQNWCTVNAKALTVCLASSPCLVFLPEPHSPSCPILGEVQEVQWLPPSRVCDWPSVKTCSVEVTLSALTSFLSSSSL